MRTNTRLAPSPTTNFPIRILTHVMWNVVVLMVNFSTATNHGSCRREGKGKRKRGREGKNGKKEERHIRSVRIGPVTTACPSRVHYGTLTVSVYPLDRRSDGGRGESVTISRQRRRCRGMMTSISDWRERNSNYTSRNKLCRWSPRVGQVITATTTIRECSSNAVAAAVTTTILPRTSATRRSVDDRIDTEDDGATGPHRKLPLSHPETHFLARPLHESTEFIDSWNVCRITNW